MVSMGRSLRGGLKLLDSYYLKYKGGNIGQLNVDMENDVWQMNINDEYSGDVPWIIRHSPGGVPSKELVRNWVLSRAPERNYEWIDRMLDLLGMREYDEYEFFKYNNGMFITDDFSVERK